MFNELFNNFSFCKYHTSIVCEMNGNDVSEDMYALYVFTRLPSVSCNYSGINADIKYKDYLITISVAD